MILKNSAFLALFSFAGLLLGLIRDRLLAHYVGIGPELDVYNAAFRVPDFLYAMMLSFASSSTIVPFIADSLHAKDKLLEKFNSLLFFFGGAIILLAGIAVLILPYVTPFIVPGFSSFQRSEFIFLTSILMVQPFFLGVSMLISCLSQAKEKFALYSISPLVYTLFIMLGIVFGYPRYGLIGIIGGVILGAVLHFLLQSYTLVRENIAISYHFFSFVQVKKHLHIAWPRSGSFIVSNIRGIFFTAFATLLGPGVLSIYVFASKVMDAWINVIAQSISMASLPRLSRYVVAQENDKYSYIFKKTIIGIAGISCLFTVVCVLFSQEIIYIIFGNIAYKEDIAHLLVLLSLSIPFHAVNFYMGHAFSAMKDTKSILIGNILASVAGILVCLFTRELGIVSLALGTFTIGVVFMTHYLLSYATRASSYEH